MKTIDFATHSDHHLTINICKPLVYGSLSVKGAYVNYMQGFKSRPDRDSILNQSFPHVWDACFLECSTGSIQAGLAPTIAGGVTFRAASSKGVHYPYL